MELPDPSTVTFLPKADPEEAGSILRPHSKIPLWLIISIPIVCVLGIGLIIYNYWDNDIQTTIEQPNETLETMSTDL